MTINITNFKENSEFTDRKTYNSNNEMFLAVHKKDLTPSEYIAFKRFIKLACNVKERVFGVTFVSIKRIVEYVGSYDLKETGISRSTVKRMLSKIKNLGLIEVIERTGKNGRQTSNLYIFKKFGQKSNEIVCDSQAIEPAQTEGEQLEVPSQKEEVFEQLNHLNTSNLILNTNNHLNTRTENENSNIIDNKILGKEYIKESVPYQFVNLASSFYNDFQTVEEYWKMVEIAQKKAGYEIPEFDLIAVATDSLKETVKALKINKIKKNSYAFFYGTVKKMLKDLYEQFYKPEEPLFELPFNLRSSVPAYNPVLKVDTFITREEANELGLY